MRTRDVKQLEVSSEQDAARWEAVDEATESLLENDPHQALVLLRAVIEQDPRNPYAYYYVGTAMFEVGRFDAAVDAYEAALRVAPTYLAARVGLSHSLRIEGDLQAALDHARKALEQSPADGDALFALGLVQASMGDRTNAIRSLEAFLRSGPELEISLEARAALAKLMDEQAPED